ncbi:hypothetical protein LUX32_03690 [Actinomadura madurae]|nr:hypothetical protein [Actinomadura madurae]MCP9976871.1 hypothetical protein [Actinomadura madurae]
MPGGADDHPGHDQRPGRHLGQQPGGEPAGREQDHRGHREEGHARLHRRVPLDDLHVVGHEEERPEHPDHGHAHGQVGAAAGAAGDHAQRQQRLPHPALDEGERGEQHRTGGQEADDLRRAPAVGLGLAGAVHDRDEPAGHQQHAGDVEPGLAVTPRLLQQREPADRREQGDGDVDVQAPAPVQVVGQRPADQQADRTARSGDAAPDPERLGAVLRLGERHRQQRQRGRPEQRAEPSLQGTGHQQHLDVRRRAPERRSGGEAEQRDQEGPLAAGVVGDPAAEQQQAAERQRVRGDDPLPVAVGDREVPLERRQRDVHHGGVQDDH